MDNIEQFTTAAVALSWTVAVLAAAIHLLGTTAGWWPHDNLTTYGATLAAMAVNVVALVVTVRL